MYVPIREHFSALSSCAGIDKKTMGFRTATTALGDP